MFITMPPFDPARILAKHGNSHVYVVLVALHALVKVRELVPEVPIENPGRVTGFFAQSVQAGFYDADSASLIS
jgi:hypothetical protein